MEEAYKLGRRIRAFRKLKGYTQESFARALSVSISVLGEIERGNRPLNEDLKEMILTTLQITEEELLGGE